MNMALVAKYADEGAPAGAAAGVRIDPALTQNLGMRFAVAQMGTLGGDLAATAVVDFNQRDVAVVQARADGFVQRVYNRAPGDVLVAGAPLADLLIPSWGGAQGEYLAVRRTGEAALIQAARQRLLLLGMSDALITSVERSGRPRTVITVTSPIAGAIRTLSVRSGMTVTQGMTLTEVSGLSTVWLNAAIPEALAGQIRIGQAVEARLCRVSLRAVHGPPDRAVAGGVRRQPNPDRPRRDAEPGRASASRHVWPDRLRRGGWAGAAGSVRGRDPHWNKRRGHAGPGGRSLSAGSSPRRPRGGRTDRSPGGAIRRRAHRRLGSVPDRFRGQSFGCRGPPHRGRLCVPDAYGPDGSEAVIAAIIRASVKGRFLVLMAALALLAAGLWALRSTPVDALPDLSDVQVIIRTSYPGQAPQIVENQVTYPLATTMLSVPGARTVRGYSFFGDSYVYVLFKDGTDLYWARSRVLEYLSQVQSRLPDSARPALGPRRDRGGLDL